MYFNILHGEFLCRNDVNNSFQLFLIHDCFVGLEEKEVAAIFLLRVFTIIYAQVMLLTIKE